jgi:GcrA cell cycle regulator
MGTVLQEIREQVRSERHQGKKAALPSIWTDELKERVKALFEEHSASVVANILRSEDGISLTKNAILGALFRMGVTKTKIAKRSPRPRIKATLRSPRPRLRIIAANSNSSAMHVLEGIETAQPKLRCVEIEPLRFTLFDLGLNECRYPYGGDNGEAITFCGHPKDGESSYCAAHHQLTRLRRLEISDEERERRRQWAQKMRNSFRTGAEVQP